MSLPLCLPSPLRAALLMFVLVTATACVHAAELKLAVSRSPLSLPVFVAQAEGYFADEGLELKLVDCVNGFRCIRMVVEGLADFGTTADVPMALTGFTASNWAIVATIAASTLDVKVVARKSADLQVPKQLAGKRVGMIPATVSEYYLETFLVVHEIDPAAVTTVPLAPDELVQALVDGRVDAIAVWEPIAFKALRALKGGAHVLPNRAALRETWSLIVHRRLVAPAHPDVVKMLRALDRAQRFIQQEPTRAKAMLRTQLDADAELVDWVWPQIRYRLSLDHGLLKALESEARWAVREGHVAERRIPNFLPLFHSAPLREVKPEAVGITQ